MNRQTWIITFNSDAGANDVDYQANTLEKFLLDASSDIDVIQRPSNEYAQGGEINLVVTILTSSAVVAAIKAIETWIKSTHGSSIDIEGEDIKVKAQNITSKNYKHTLEEMLKHVQRNNGEKKEP